VGSVLSSTGPPASGVCEGAVPADTTEPSLDSRAASIAVLVCCLAWVQVNHLRHFRGPCLHVQTDVADLSLTAIPTSTPRYSASKASRLQSSGATTRVQKKGRHTKEHHPSGSGPRTRGP
jgi:hypothetical protein